LHPGRSASLWVNGPSGGSQPVGYAGELHPVVLQRLELPGRALVAELDLLALAGAGREQVRFAPLPRYPSVVRDLALVAPVELAAARVLEWVRAHAGPLARQVKLFDVYTGPGLPEGTRSLGISITYQAADRTLSDAEVDEAVRALLQALEPLGLRLR
ncbi:MAG TPA: hypothetical protein VIL11_06325, partial [Limnochordales bacterium]